MSRSPDIFRAIATTAGLDDPITAHIGRHTFATTLVRGGADLVTVAERLGHARLDTVRTYTRPTADDRAKALNLLPTTVDQIQHPRRQAPGVSGCYPV